MLRKVLSVFALHLIADEETWAAYREHKLKLIELEKKIEAQFWKSPQAQLIRAGSGGVSTPKTRFEERDRMPSLVIEHYADLIELKPSPQSIEPTILNTLLHTKLLTDEEKRSLLQEQGILKPKEVTPTPEA